MAQAQVLPVVTFPFQFQDKSIRTQPDGGTLWFAARDVCDALTIKWNGRALSAILEQWQGLRNFLTPSGNQRLRAIAEPAVYKLAFRPNKPEADTFVVACSRAAAAKALASCFFTPGAIPSASMALASSRFRRAAFNDTEGYAPRLNVFRFPAKR